MNKLNIRAEHLNAIMHNDSKHAEKEVLFRQALIDYPEYEPGILYYIMICLAIEDKNQECIDVCERLISLLDENDEISSIYLYEGKRYVDLKNTDKAIECFNKSISFDNSYSGSSEAISELADIYKERLDWDNVIKVYDFITDEEKYCIEDQTSKLFEKGYAYSMKKEQVKAIEYYDKYLKLVPDDSGVMLNKGIMYGELNKYDEAIASFKQSLEIDPNFVDAYYSLGIVYNAKGDFYMALHNYMEALKIDPKHMPSIHNIGAITINDLDDAKKGIELMEKALALCKDDDPVKATIILSLCHINKHLTNFERGDYYQAEFMKLLGLDIDFGEEEDNDEEDDD